MWNIFDKIWLILVALPQDYEDIVTSFSCQILSLYRPRCHQGIGLYHSQSFQAGSHGWSTGGIWVYLMVQMAFSGGGTVLLSIQTLVCPSHPISDPLRSILWEGCGSVAAAPLSQLLERHSNCSAITEAKNSWIYPKEALKAAIWAYRVCFCDCYTTLKPQWYPLVSSVILV